MAYDANSIQKADQIAHRVFNKFALVIHNARVTMESTESSSKDDEWFNLKTPNTESYKEKIRSYRSISSLPSLPPAFELRVLLTIPELTNNQVLVYHNPPASRIKIEPTPKHIMLESWQLTLASFAADSGSAQEVTLATVYKHCISLFRSLYTLLRVLPTWKLRKRLRRRPGSLRNGQLGMEVRVGEAGPSPEGVHVLGFDMPLSATTSPLRTQTHVFPPITHPFGSLSVSVKYLSEPYFLLDTMESLLSSRFLSQDEGPEFTPTLARNQQRDSMSGSPGSLPMRTSLPRSPPTPSVADRFVLSPSPGRMAFPRTSPQMKNVSLPSPLNPSTSGAAGSTGSGSGSSTRLSREDTSAAISNRLNAMRGPDLPSAPRPTPIRRPSINSIHPFKSSTLSSGSPSFHSPSPSLKQHSPLSAGPSLSSRPAMVSSPASTSRAVSTSSQAVPVGITSRTMSSPIAPLRPSPPFAPSSLGGRGSPLVELPSGGIPVRPKRYSSSFGHRYAAAGGASSEGSAGSGDRERKESERVSNASFLSTNTDDDDITTFVQDIDARRPLRGETPRTPASDSTRSPNSGLTSTDETSSERDRPTELIRIRERRDRTVSEGVLRGVPAMMILSHMAVDERLRQLNEAFNASLNGMDRRSSSDNELPSSKGSPLSIGGIGYTNSSNASSNTNRATGHIRRAATTTSASSGTSNFSAGQPLLDIVIPVPRSPSGSSSPSGSVGFGLGFEPEPRPRGQTHARSHTHTRERTRSVGGNGGSEETNVVGRLEFNDSDRDSNSSKRGSGLRHGL